MLQLDFEPQARNGKGLKAFDWKKKGANGQKIAAVLPVRTSARFVVEQAHGDRTAFQTDEVRIESRSSAGRPWWLCSWMMW